MPRNPNIPRADQRYLRYAKKPDKSYDLIKIGSEAWFEWLEHEETRSFSFEGFNGRFTARKESKKRGNKYWYAYRWINGKTTKAYLGSSQKLTRSRLNEVAGKLSQQQLVLPFS